MIFSNFSKFSNINTAQYLFISLGNLARQRPVWEDSPWKGYENWRATKAVDGRYDYRSAAGGQCVISQNHRKTATWRVDLGQIVSISHIDIYYRTDNFQSTKYLNCCHLNIYDDQCLGKTIKYMVSEKSCGKASNYIGGSAGALNSVDNVVSIIDINTCTRLIIVVQC